MAALVEGQADVAAHRRVKAHLAHGVVRREERRGEVIVAVGDPDVEIGVAAHGAVQELGRVEVFVLDVAVVPRTHLPGERVVGQVVLVFKFAAHVLVETRAVGAVNRLVARVEVRLLGAGLVADAREPRIVAADRPVLVREQFAGEGEDVDAQVALRNGGLGQAGERRQFLRQRSLVLRRQGVAEHERGCVFVLHELLGGLHRRAEIGRGERTAEFFVIPSGRGVGGQEELIRQVVALREAGGLEIHDRGDERDAVQVEAVALLQVIGETRGARCAVAFTDQEFRRGPALVARSVEPDEVAHGRDVLGETMELFRILVLGRAAVAGRDRVDEDEVRGVEPGCVIVHHPVGRRKRLAFFRHDDALGADRAHVQPDGGGAGAAVEGKSHGPLRGIDLLGVGVEFGVGDEEDVRLGLLVLRVLHQHVAGGGAVFDDLAPDGQLVLGDGQHGLLLLLGRCGGGGLLVRVLVLFLGLFLGGGQGAGGETEQ